MCTTIVDFYRLNNSENNIRMDLTVGHGQESASDLSVDSLTDEKAIKNSFTRTLGTNKTLKGKTLRCVTTVNDIQQVTDQTSILLELNGGIGQYSQSRNKAADPPGSVVSYLIIIYFI